MAAPIIIPVTNTRTRDCIVQDGVRYCESTPKTAQDIGFIGVSVLVIIVWFLAIVWCMQEERYWAAGLIVIAPFVLMSLGLFI